MVQAAHVEEGERVWRGDSYLMGAGASVHSMT